MNKVHCYFFRSSILSVSNTLIGSVALFLIGYPVEWLQGATSTGDCNTLIITLIQQHINRKRTLLYVHDNWKNVASVGWKILFQITFMTRGIQCVRQQQIEQQRISVTKAAYNK